MLAECRLPIQLALGIVFSISSAAKLRDPGGFARAVAAYQLLPSQLAPAVASSIIVVESCLAIGHLTGFGVFVVIPLGIGTLAAFGVGVSTTLIRGKAPRCYCFGPTDGVISLKTLIRVGVLTGGEIILFLTMRSANGPRSPIDFGLALLWAADIVVVTVWLFAIPDVVRLLRTNRISGKLRN